MAKNLLDQRRHQRIRFGIPPSLQIGYAGEIGEGKIENISLSGLMFRSDLALDIGRTVGCEFSLFGSPVVDVPASIVSRVGDLFGARFQTGPINQVMLDDAIAGALMQGQASVLTVHELSGRKVMRISGGLNATLRSDFMHSLTRVGIDEIDLSGVTMVDQAGLALCLVATRHHAVKLGMQAECFAEAWNAALAAPGEAKNSCEVLL